MSQPHQVVCREGEGKPKVYLAKSAMLELAQPAHGLGPTEAFFDALTHPQALNTTRLTGGTAVKGRAPAGIVLGRMRTDAAVPKTQYSARFRLPDCPLFVSIFQTVSKQAAIFCDTLFCET